MIRRWGSVGEEVRRISDFFCMVIKVHSVGKVGEGEWGSQYCFHLSYTDTTCAHASMGKDGSCVRYGTL